MAGEICEGRNCGKPATHTVHVDMATRKYFYCDDCKALFEASAEKLPIHNKRSLMELVKFVPLESNAREIVSIPKGATLVSREETERLMRHES